VSGGEIVKEETAGDAMGQSSGRTVSLILQLAEYRIHVGKASKR
jgi:hypothetical protein